MKKSGTEYGVRWRGCAVKLHPVAMGRVYSLVADGEGTRFATRGTAVRVCLAYHLQVGEVEILRIG